MGNVSDKICRENLNTYFMLSNFFFGNRAFYEIVFEKYCKALQTSWEWWLMYVACWIPKSKNTQSEYVILIAFLLHQWLHERASMIRDRCTACLVVAPPYTTSPSTSRPPKWYSSFVTVTFCELLVLFMTAANPSHSNLPYFTTAINGEQYKLLLLLRHFIFQTLPLC